MVPAVSEIPLILAGPLLRRVTPELFSLWWVSSRPLAWRLRLGASLSNLQELILGPESLRCLPLGARVWLYLLAVRIPRQWHITDSLYYELLWREASDQPWISLWEQQPELTYTAAPAAVPVLGTVREIWHGSCRKPHHPVPDALVTADRELEKRLYQGHAWPDLLLMTGDQIYNDDLCGPMLLAVHQGIALLGLPNEVFPAGPVPDAETLYRSPQTLYGRRAFLPQVLAEHRLSRLFNLRGKPVFSSQYCDNHLISFAESFLLYLLSWSPALWRCIHLPKASDLDLSVEKQQLYTQEKQALEAFVAGLPRVQRLLAHLPTYMIFDDHDITDDWNLSEAWEEAAYGHPFSRRIIGNALMAYWLCQGWGNDPQAFSAEFWQQVQACFEQPEPETQEAWIETLLNFEHWHYHLPSQPKILVLDTRSRRWYSEQRPELPSGLMDWESLSELQQEILHQDAVVLVSPAPIFGVKLIEVVQHLLSWCGYALAVDAENWMAHPQAASSLLSIFKHAHSPRRVVILSGDVHYSFVYDIVIRFHRNSPHIWQITASGLKNTFPEKILQVLSRFNRLLFHRNSPLNWLTARKRMKIEPRRAQGQRSWQLVNCPALGRVALNPAGEPWQIGLLTGDGAWIIFEPDDDSPIGPLQADERAQPRVLPRRGR